MDAESRNDGGDEEESRPLPLQGMHSVQGGLRVYRGVLRSSSPRDPLQEQLRYCHPAKPFCRLGARGSPQRTHRVMTAVFASSDTP